ncbi:ABC transporter permease, partial [bacterium]|nr:ABC transporter permease [bacterium]
MNYASIVFSENTKLLTAMSVIKRYMAVFIIISLTLVMSIASEQFRTMNNFMNIVKQAAVLGCISVGVGILLIQKSFDLSIGSILSLTHVLVIWLLAAGFHPFFAVILTLLGGAACGMVNGFFVGYLKGNSMMVTFGAQVIFQGIALLLTKGKYITCPRGTGFEYLAKGYIGSIPVPAIIMIVL